MSEVRTQSFASWIWLLLLATLGLTWYTSQQDEDVPIVQPKKSEIVAHVESQPDLPTAALQLLARKSYESNTDIFGVEKPAPKIVPRIKVPVEKVVPILPPLPFKYIGRWKDESGMQVLLEANGEVLTAKAGDTLLGRYQVKNIQETAFNVVIEFLTLPENQQQNLQVGKTKDE